MSNTTCIRNRDAFAHNFFALESHKSRLWSRTGSIRRVRPFYPADCTYTCAFSYELSRLLPEEFPAKLWLCHFRATPRGIKVSFRKLGFFRGERILNRIFQFWFDLSLISDWSHERRRDFNNLHYLSQYGEVNAEFCILNIYCDK